MENIDLTHPVAKEELKNIGVSVQRNNFGIVHAIDLAGEQTYMINAKNIAKTTNLKPEKLLSIDGYRVEPLKQYLLMY